MVEHKTTTEWLRGQPLRGAGSVASGCSTPNSRAGRRWTPGAASAPNRERARALLAEAGGQPGARPAMKDEPPPPASPGGGPNGGIAVPLFSISADSHVTEPGDCYLDRIDPRYRDRAPVAVTDDRMGAVMVIDRGKSRVPYGMVAAAGRPAESIGPFEHVGWDELHQGGWDPVARLDEQTRDGVATEVLYPSVGMLLCNLADADYKKACFDAYNLWIAEFESHDPRRLVGVGQTALRSVEEGVEDLVRIKDLGLRGVMLPGYAACHADGDYDDPRWDPLWRAAAELGLPLSFHILTSGNDVVMSPQYRGPKMNSFLGII